MLTGIPLLLVILLAVVFIILGVTRFGIHPFMVLLLASFGVGMAAGIPLGEVVTAITEGFGGLLGYIGLIVVLGSIIGVFLERSGGAMRIADWMLRKLGRQRPALAISVIGATVSVPVFCDSGFILLSGLNRSLAQRTGQREATLSLALASGLYTTHTLVPPTPGPIAAAGNLGASDYLGTIILIGILLSIPTMLVAYWWAYRQGATIESRHETELPEAVVEEQRAQPSVFWSLAPILLPIVLIAGASLIKFVDWEGPGVGVFLFLGEPLTALLLGVLLCLPLARYRDAGSAPLREWVGDGLKLAGPILIITGAGGAFGSVLKATPIADTVSQWVGGSEASGVVVILLAFGISALLKTAQGSSTSALVISSSMLAPLMPELGFEQPLELALVVMAVGGGAMTVSHANDSYFWVVSQFSGIQMSDAYRSHTLMTGLQGVTVLLGTLILYLLLG